MIHLQYNLDCAVNPEIPISRNRKWVTKLLKDSTLFCKKFWKCCVLHSISWIVSFQFIPICVNIAFLKSSKSYTKLMLMWTWSLSDDILLERFHICTGWCGCQLSIWVKLRPTLGWLCGQSAQVSSYGACSAARLGLSTSVQLEQQT